MAISERQKRNSAKFRERHRERIRAEAREYQRKLRANPETRDKLNAYYRKRRSEHPYYKTEHYLEVNRKRVARYERRNPEKKKCRVALNHAVQAGKIVRPDYCTRCGLICKPEAHHPDHSKPFEVIWACKDCHSFLERASPLATVK